MILQPGIREIHIPKKTKEWHDFRKNGIGASEVASVMGLSPYAPTVTQIWRDKVGLSEPADLRNPHVLMGGEIEPIIVKLARYWDGTQHGWVDNYYDNRVIRDIQSVDTYIVNDRYPHLFFSLDAYIPAGEMRLDTVEGELTGECLWVDHPMELKNISGYNSRKWVGGVPIMNFVQLQSQMIGVGVDYGELCQLIDNSGFQILPFTRNEEWSQKIIEETTAFWDSVLLGRKALAAGDMEMLEYLEPMPDANVAYEAFYAEEFKNKNLIETAKGSESLIEKANKYKLLQDTKDEIEEIQQLYKNQITKEFVEKGCEKMLLDDNGYIRYHQQKNWSKRALDFRGFKPSYSEELVSIFVKTVKRLM